MPCPALLSLSSVAWLWLGASAAPPPSSKAPTAPLTDLRPGQSGVCHTVFAGDAVEPMTFVVRGVLPNYLGPHHDLLLVRLTGERPEFTGVVSGMSGSPCYVDGKLVGALGYSFAQFAKEPIAGITPIADMLAIFERPTATLPWRRAAVAPAASGHGDLAASPAGWPSAAHVAAFGAGPLSQLQLPPVLAGARAPGAAAAAADGLRPLALPTSVGGIGPGAMRWLRDYLGARGFVAQAAGGKANAVDPQPLVPGGSVAAVLVRGDVDIAATGTVSWTDGRRVLAFGHPFLGTGPASLPMANAYVVNTMVSAQHSFKMATTGATVGEVVHDRLTAIGGVLGQSPQMVPVRGTVVDGAHKAPFAFEVARSPELTPQLLLSALVGALDNRLEATSHGTVHMTATVRMAGVPDVVVRQVAASNDGAQPLVRMATTVGRAFDLLWNPPDGATPGEASVAVTATVQPEVHEEAIDALHLDAACVEAGQTVHAAVTLVRQDAPPATVRFAWAVPPSWAGQELTVVAAGSAAAEQLLAQATGAPAPRTRLQVAQVLQALRAPDEVHLLVLKKGASLQRNGASYAFLPPSAENLFRHAPHHTTAKMGLAAERRTRRAGRVEGLARASLQVAPAH